LLPVLLAEKGIDGFRVGGDVSNLQRSISDLASMLLFAFLAIVAVMIVYVVWHMRNRKMKDYRRRKYLHTGELSEKLDLTTVLPDLSRDEMKRIALEEKAMKGDEGIDLENYNGLPLKPKVYFDPDKDKKDTGESIKPKIMRSFLSNEPLPKDDGEGEG
jgi:hypothetical protein